ncbi:hypothetical protein L1887_56649 [Cichorium endivia]|nr:hypothetical protein L1887_56649 [Cichorium endivia]
MFRGLTASSLLRTSSPSRWLLLIIDEHTRAEFPTVPGSATLSRFVSWLIAHAVGRCLHTHATTTTAWALEMRTYAFRPLRGTEHLPLLISLLAWSLARTYTL